MGGVGLAILVFVFGLEPTSPPIDVMLMIAAVISAAAAMQAAGGLDWLVKVAEKLLRKNPSQVTIISPLVTYLFTFVAGTGHVAYSVLPVIAEVARETKIRPERPLGIAVIASQQAITASPISAATVALLCRATPSLPISGSEASLEYLISLSMKIRFLSMSHQMVNLLIVGAYLLSAMPVFGHELQHLLFVVLHAFAEMFVAVFMLPVDDALYHVRNENTILFENLAIVSQRVG